MRWNPITSGSESLTESEMGNAQAARWRAYRGWTGLIHWQRQRRIARELEGLGERLAWLRENDSARYYEGDWSEVMDGLIYWNNRDPFDEAMWTATSGDNVGGP
jgi:hypothetical protein